MTSFSVSTATTTPQSLIGGETGLVTATGSIFAASGNAVSANGGGRLVVSGSVVGAGSNYASFFYGSGDGYLTLSSTGIMAGNRGLNCEATMLTFALNNAGTMQGTIIGAQIFAHTATILNSGSITGNNTTGVYLSNQTSYHISNSGEIDGSYYGVYQGGIGEGTILNSGRISGAVYALVSGNGVERVVNTGELVGSVLLAGGNDTLLGGHGLQNEVYGGTGADSIVGGAAGEILDGGTDNDVLRGNGADDRLNGQGGNDSVWGGADDDALDGGTGADFLYGGSGDDALTGGADADRLYGGWGDDALNGGAGADVFVFAPGHGNDRIYGFADNFDKMDLRSFDIASLTVLKAHASNSALGLRIDLHDFDGGSLILAGMTYAKLTAADVLL